MPMFHLLRRAAQRATLLVPMLLLPVLPAAAQAQAAASFPPGRCV